MTSRFRRFAAAGIVAILAARSARSEPLSTGRELQEGRVLHAQDVGSFPVNMIVSPDGKFAITTDIGYRQAIWAIRLDDGAGIGHVAFPNREAAKEAIRLFDKVESTAKQVLSDSVEEGGSPELSAAISRRALKSYGLYYGLAIAADGTLYAAQGANDTIALLTLSSDGALTPKSRIKTRPDDFPAGLCLDDRGHLYVTNQSAGGKNPYESSGSVAIYDTIQATEIGRYTFSNSFHGTTNYPLAIAALHDGSKIYIASERDNAVYVLDARTPTKPQLAATISVGTHPSALIMDRAQKRAFVANADSDSVSVIDAATDKVTSTLLVRPTIARELPGCTPTALALSSDEKQLFVTLSDLNAIAVMDLAAGTLTGFIPTGWYPSTLALSPDQKHLLVANAKGIKTRIPSIGRDPKTGQPTRKASPLDLLEGDVQLLPIPDEDELSQLTQQVITNSHLDKLELKPVNPLASIGLKSGKITHVLYIIKENRTYDQVLGDVKQGNGDPSLCIFGRDVTPNLHALADRFVLLDNLYASGEVSGDGWIWSTQSMANAYVARNIPYNYSERGRKFDFEGQNNGYPTGGFPAKGIDGKPIAANPIFNEGGKPIPDVAESPGGHIWDMCRKQGVTFRNYGFYETVDDNAVGVAGGPDNYPSVTGLQPAGHDLDGATDIDYRRFDLKYADSDAPNIWFNKSGDANCLFPTKSYGKHDSTSRFSEWNREFQMMLAKAPDGSAVPALMFLRMGLDHTTAASSGAHTPRSDVADNDYAIGQVVDAVSHSPIWEHTAIFVIEDDAQAGADHVDCHRTTGYVISPYIQRNAVDHRFYNTVSYLRTIEALLDLPPMTQYDATSDWLHAWTDGEPANREPFDAILPTKEIIAERNPETKSLSANDPRREMVAQSDAMDFVHPDAVPSEELNAIVWRTVKGIDATPPASKPSPLAKFVGAKDDDDDE